MFTVKFRHYELSDQQPPKDCVAPKKFYDECEYVSGPYQTVQKRMDDGWQIVTAYDGANPGYTWGPFKDLDEGQPRPTIWVMNDQGSTIAKYEL